MSTFGEMTEYANWIIKNPSAYLIDIDARIAFAREYLALQTRVEELEKLSNAHKKLACLVDQQQLDLRASISKAVEEIEELGKYGEHSLGILHKHGLIGEQK